MLFVQEEVREIMRDRRLGFSFVRLLPKETGIRPLVNLSYRSIVQRVCRLLLYPTVSDTQHRLQPTTDGKRPQSINQMLQAAFQILTLEKVADVVCRVTLLTGRRVNNQVCSARPPSA